VSTRLVLNCFAPAFSADAAVEAAIERSRAAVVGAEGVADGGAEASLDLVQVEWLDFKVRVR
jgi:hypothetical protein